MTPEQIVDAILVLIKQHGFDGRLDKQELVALTGVCLQEFERELELAAKFLGESPSRESLLDFYQTERAKETQELGDQVDTTRSTVDIGKLKAVPFSPAMWEVVKESRFVGHLSKLDEVNKYFALKWGNPAEGSSSIDAYLRRQRRDDEAMACKNPPSSYPDWEVYNRPSGEKQPVRFRSDLIMCENAGCSSEGRFFNEAEAFYLFAKQSLLRRLLARGSFYICPYCGGTKVRPLLPGRVDEPRPI